MVEQNVVRKFIGKQYKKVNGNGGPISSVSMFSKGVGEAYYEHINGSWNLDVDDPAENVTVIGDE